MCPFGYYMMIRNYKDKKYVRLKMVQYAGSHGNKPAARMFGTTVKTVRKWMRRWKSDGLLGLEEKLRRPNHCPQAVSEEVKRRVRRAKREKGTLGAQRLKEMYNIPCSEKAIRNILRNSGLMKKKRRKHKTKQDLRAVKALWHLFEQIDVDTKHLYDIPEYWHQMKALGLPRYQYTARDVVSGLQFIGYSDDLSLSVSIYFVKRIIEHLIENNALNGGSVRWQTDNGSEFIGAMHAKDVSEFTRMIEGHAGHSHHQIPPGAHRFQADVETVHDRIEDEFYCLETFKSRPDFLQKAAAYQDYFNLVRKNYHKGKKTPLDIIKERNPSLTSKTTQLSPLFLDETMYKKSHQRGYDVVPGPSFSC